MTTPSLVPAAAAAVRAAGAPPADPAQYLTFMLAGEAFAIGILSIKEIIEYGGLTTVPMMPECVRGVINLRGAVVPVIDLQTRFGRASSEVTKRTCIVIAEVQGGDGPQVIGVIVDVVNEVLDISPADIEPPPAFGARIRQDFIAGMGKVRGRFVILLAIDAVLSITDDDALARAVASAGALDPARLN